MSWREEREHLIDAMVRAEGGPDAMVRAVRCSIPSCKDYAEAREIALNTVTHALWDFAMRQGADAFVEFLAARWAPVGAANDPTNLNANWPRNVLAALARGREGA